MSIKQGWHEMDEEMLDSAENPDDSDYETDEETLGNGEYISKL